MQKRFFNVLFVFLSTFLVFSTSLCNEKKPWTFLVYLAAANDLNPFADRDIAEMMKVGSNENVNIIVYLTLQRDFGPKETMRLYVNRGSVTQIGATTSEDSGSVYTLMRALEWANDDFPSDHIAVVLWDHGSGALNRSRKPDYMRGICYDYDTNNYLTDRDCLQAFSWGRDNLRDGKKYDIVACDACIMACVEVAYTFADCANYFVASQENIPGDGYEYAGVLDEFYHSVPTPYSFARSMVEAYSDEYKGETDFTLSVVDLNKLKELLPEMNAINEILFNALDGKQSKRARKAIKKSISGKKCPCFDEGTYADLYNFYKNMKKYASKMKLSKKDKKRFKNMVKNSYKKLKKAVIAKVSSKGYKKAGGISIYFPEYYIDSSYEGLYWSEYSNWLKVLEAYVS